MAADLPSSRPAKSAYRARLAQYAAAGRDAGRAVAPVLARAAGDGRGRGRVPRARARATQAWWAASGARRFGVVLFAVARRAPRPDRAAPRGGPRDGVAQPRRPGAARPRLERPARALDCRCCRTPIRSPPTWTSSGTRRSRRCSARADADRAARADPMAAAWRRVDDSTRSASVRRPCRELAPALDFRQHVAALGAPAAGGTGEAVDGDLPAVVRWAEAPSEPRRARVGDRWPPSRSPSRRSAGAIGTLAWRGHGELVAVDRRARVGAALVGPRATRGGHRRGVRRAGPATVECADRSRPRGALRGATAGRVTCRHGDRARVAARAGATGRALRRPALGVALRAAADADAVGPARVAAHRRLARPPWTGGASLARGRRARRGR